MRARYFQPLLVFGLCFEAKVTIFLFVFFFVLFHFIRFASFCLRGSQITWIVLRTWPAIDGATEEHCVYVVSNFFAHNFCVARFKLRPFRLFINLIYALMAFLSINSPLCWWSFQFKVRTNGEWAQGDYRFVPDLTPSAPHSPSLHLSISFSWRGFPSLRSQEKSSRIASSGIGF